MFIDGFQLVRGGGTSSIDEKVDEY